MTDTETAAAIEALAHRIRSRDTTAKEGGEVDDAEPFAMEFITALRGRGWRCTEAKTHQPWQRTEDGDSPQPAGDKPGGAGYLAAKEEVLAKAERAAAEKAARERRNDAA